jgi:UDP-2-acetamido-3-amino-2,3-dideoxy-glucuronate N-acetyltransferase
MQVSQRIALQNESVAWTPCHLGEGLTVGNKCSIGALAHIGRNTTLGSRCRIQGGAYIADGCTVESDVFIGPNATLLNDRYPPSKDAGKWQPVVVKSGAVIGGGATVLPGVVVGVSAVLAAGSTLTKHLPDNEVWAGNPATFLMTRPEYEQKGGR